MKTSCYLRLCAAVCSLAFVSCAGEDDIDRTQANRLPKSMFDGVWYMRSTVIDVPGTSTSSWVGQTSSTEKIRWEIQEKWLLAYRSYEEIPGTDTSGKAEQDATEYKENPVAAFPIESHFDVKRDYNAATGEQNNVISENRNDRPWYERDWIRVDWSNSTVDGEDFWGAGGKVNSNVQFFVQGHEDDPDAMRVIDQEGERVDFESLSTVRSRPASQWAERIDYFDMVGRFVLEPETVTLRFGGTSYDYPLCWFISYRGGNYQTVSCGPTENRVRTSFMRAKTRNYEPRELPNREMGKFGYFRTERFTYDRRYGFTESGRIYLANKHNIWEKAYETEEDGSLRTDADGNFVSIPIADRVPKPVVYYLNEDYPCDLVAQAHEIADSWNRAFRKTVAIAKGLITHTEGDTEQDLAQISTDQVPNMFVLNNNGWVQKTQGDNWSCENLERDETEAIARIGDLRFNFMTWVNDRQVAGPLGYGPSSADPETGEIIAGMAHVYGAAIDRYANYALEIVRLLNDDLAIDDFVSGKNVRDYIAQSRPALDPAQIPGEVANLRGSAIADSLIPEKMQSKLAALRAGGLDQLAIRHTSDPFETLAGTEYEKYLIDEEVMRGVGPSLVSGTLPQSIADLTQAARDALSPSNWASEQASALENARLDRAAAQSLWLAEFSDDAIQGLATEIWKRYGESKDYDAMFQHLRALIFRGVMEHEVGHTIGLRHNFAGSYDSLNYFNNYWSMRTEADGEGNGGIAPRNPLHNDGQLTLRQLYSQAKQTDAQIEGRMREYQYSSIMDYHSKFNSDVHGIGKYDEAAVLFGYGDYVEVFDDVSNAAKATLRQRYDDCISRYESIPNPAYDYLLEQWHYSSIWNLLGGTEKLIARRFKPWADVKAEQASATDLCKERVAAGETVSDFVDREDTARDAEVPYMFCPDEYNGSTQSCHRWDQGADPYEQIQNIVDSYKAYYFLNNFKRDRFGFNAYSVFRRVARNYFSYIPNTYQHWLFETQFNELQDTTLSNYWTMATFSGFNTLMDVVTTPQYGTYCRFNEVTGDCSATGAHWGLVSDDTTPTTRTNRYVIDRGIGRRRFSRYDYESGYDYQDKILETGHFWEYLAAIDALTSEYGTFVGREIASDFTTYLVPYYLTFEDELTRYFEGVVNETYDDYAPRIVDNQLKLRVAAPLVWRNGGTELQLDSRTGLEVGDETAGQSIDMANWFTLRYYTLIMGMAKFRSLYSLRYSDRQQIFRVGSGDEVTPATGKEVYSCQDPIGGHIYGTLRDPGVPDDEQPSAVKMLQQCNEQATAYLADPNDDILEQELNNTIEWLNFMRGLYGYFGNNVQ